MSMGISIKIHQFVQFLRKNVDLFKSWLGVACFLILIFARNNTEGLLNRVSAGNPKKLNFYHIGKEFI